MATISFKEFSQGQPVSVVANEGKALREEAESGSPSLMSKLAERAKTFGSELSLKPSRDILNNAQPTENKDMVATESLLRGAQSPIRAIGAVGGAIGDVVGAGLESTGLDKPIAEALQPVVESDPVQKAMSAFKMLPQDTQDVLGAIVNTANIPLTATGAGAVKTGVQAGVKKAGEVAGKVATETASKVLPTSEGIMQRVARIPKGEQAKFEKLTGKSVGTFLDETGNYGTPDKIVERLYNDFTKSKQTADDALAQIQGTYKSAPVSTALKELEGKVERTSSPGAPDSDLARVTELVAKEKAEGLTMTEINEVKRIYERRVRLDYLKSNVAEDVTRANNVDNALRTWQFAEAEKAGLKNLPEINKFTQANKQLMDALGKEQAGIGGNNALGLTDAILIAGGSPESIASLLVKKTFSDPGVQSFVAKKLSKNKVKTGVPEANFSKQELPLSPKKESVSSPKSTPSPTKSKGIRGMVNPSELNPFKKKAKEFSSSEDFVKSYGQSVYRGTEKGGVLKESMDTDYGPGFYFANKKSTAEGYGKNVDGYFVNLKNPLKVKDRYEMNSIFDSNTTGKNIQDYLKSKGYDGIKVDNGGLAGQEGVGGFTVAFDRKSIVPFKEFTESKDFITAIQTLKKIWNDANELVPKKKVVSEVPTTAFHGTQAKDIVGTPKTSMGKMGDAFYVTVDKNKASAFGKEKNIQDNIIGASGKTIERTFRDPNFYPTSNVHSFDLSKLNIKTVADDREFFKYIHTGDVKDAKMIAELSGYDGIYNKDTGTFAIYNTTKLKKVNKAK